MRFFYVQKKENNNMQMNNKELEQTKKHYMVDWLKLRVNVNHNPDELSAGVRFDLLKEGNGYAEPMKSYKETWITTPSYDDKLKVKSMKDGSLLIEGNLGKFLTGQNVVGESDVISLVYKTILKLSDMSDYITPTEQQLEAIKKGEFKIHKIDLNKGLLFESRSEALQYLERLKFHASYPRFDKKVESNGVYFGYDSKRKTFKYYHKGTEIKVNKKYQKSGNKELQALADLMIRCELRLKWSELKDKELLNGFNWTPEKVEQLIDEAHNQLRLPEPLNFPDGLPSKYKRFITCFKAGSLVESYTTSTIDRMKRDMMKNYGVDLHRLTF